MTSFDIPAWDTNESGESSATSFGKFNKIKQKGKKKDKLYKIDGVIIKHKNKEKPNKKIKQKLKEADLFKKIDEQLNRLETLTKNEDGMIKKKKDKSTVKIKNKKDGNVHDVSTTATKKKKKKRNPLRGFNEEEKKQVEKNTTTKFVEKEIKNIKTNKKLEMKNRAIQNKMKKKLKKQKKFETNKPKDGNTEKNEIIDGSEESSKSPNKKMKLFKEKLKEVFKDDEKQLVPPSKKVVFRKLTLRERMMEKLNAAKFRILNEQIYSTEGTETNELFKEDPDSFNAYHEGYRQQVAKWPMNPLDKIIESIKKMPLNFIIADFGCGEAKLAISIKQKVHSFDLVALNDKVTACDMSHVPLDNQSVDVVVFCLSLMGTNLKDYLLEANRVLKVGGIMKIAEVESRFDRVENFINGVQSFHFKNIWKDLSNDLFYFMDFKKDSNIKQKTKMPTISLKPCLYKKR